MRRLLNFIFAILLATSVMAQGEFSLYNLNKTLPQAHQLNPAFFPRAKVTIGLPVLSSTHLSVDFDQLSFNQVFVKNSEQLYTIDSDNIATLLRDKNNFSVQSDIQLFFLGLNLGNNFFSLAVNDRVSSWMVYTDDIAKLALFGNGHPLTFEENISFDHMMLRQNLYHEVALGYARGISDNLRIGARIKYLSGVLNTQTEQINGFVRTDLDSIHITNTSFAFRNAGFDYLTGDLDILSIYRNTLPFVNNNSGFGLDAGIFYDFTDRISVSASVTDLGYIQWSENTESYEFDNVTYSFKGFDVMDLLNNNGSNSDFIDAEIDSLENLFSPQEFENVPYKSTLTSNFYLGFNYRLAKSHNVGAMVYGRYAEGNLSPEFGIYHNLTLGKVLNAVVNASFRNGKLRAAGVGASVDLGPVQIYGTTESVMSLILPKSASMLDARVGINVLIGKKKPRKELVENDEEEIVPEEEEELPEELTAEEKPPEPMNDEPPAEVFAAGVAMVAAPEPAEEEEAVEFEPIVDEPEPVQEDVMIVQQGNHKDEFAIGHYIVVGAFLSRENAVNYSNKLKAKGYDNEFGFLTAKEFYYVTVYKNIGDIEKAREVRNEFRRKKDFLFPDSWLLSVVH